MATDIIILAAGKGTRMKSALPKVAHKLAGKSLLGHVLDTAKPIVDANIIVVVGHGAEEVRQAVVAPRVHWVEQTEQLGTGHAVQQALPHIRSDSKVIILYGDVPLIREETINAMLAAVASETLALLTVRLEDPTGYGRIERDMDGKVQAIVEQKDARDEQLLISEVNTGVMALSARALHRWLPRLENNNAQGEYYLTDLIALAVSDGFSIATLHPSEPEETEGVNSREQLSRLERYYQRLQAQSLMTSGVTLADPSRFDCRGEISAGSDSFIDINCVFEGSVTLGSNVSIGPNCWIKDAVIGEHVEIMANTVIEGPVRIGPKCSVGPFARLRPGTELGPGAKIGNFVETKKASVGPGSKINHLSYVGDATLGEDVNIGAGTITCNYDGANKHRTEIGDAVFVGSNTALVAPISLGRNATVAAGSTLTKNVPEGALALTRSPQRMVSDWPRPVKKAGD